MTQHNETGLPQTATFGRYAEVPVDALSSDQRTAYERLMSERGIIPGPAKIWLQNPDLIRLLAPLGTYFHQADSR